MEDHWVTVPRAAGDIREHQVLPLRLRLRLRLRIYTNQAERGARYECHPVVQWHYQQQRVRIEKGVRPDAQFMLVAELRVSEMCSQCNK